MKTKVRDQRSEVSLRARVLECGDLSALSAGDWSPSDAPMPRDELRAAQSCDESQHSKAWRHQLMRFCLLPTFCLCAQAQYSIDWHTIEGGGGTSTGGVYTVTGTIGQPDAGQMSGGPFTLHGGFWSLIAAIQTPGAPYLTVWRTATNAVVVSWTLPAEGWVLEATNALPTVSAPWPQIPPPYQTNGPNLQVIEPLPVGNKFYRLHKP